MNPPADPDFAAIERHFHEVIRARVASIRDLPSDLVLPKVDATTPIAGAEPAWCPVPGMYGGFAYWLDFSGERPKLVSESWSRVCEGSGERHEIDAAGSTLVETGFV